MCDDCQKHEQKVGIMCDQDPKKAFQVGIMCDGWRKYSKK